MCNYQTLFHKDDCGYAVRCSTCESIQVGFGNLMLTFSTPDFEFFRQWLKQIIEETVAPPDNTLRCIVVPSPCEGVKLLLSMRELIAFDEMLESSDAELKSLEMIKLFH
jgi:hypothetical protein